MNFFLIFLLNIFIVILLNILGFNFSWNINIVTKFFFATVYISFFYICFATLKFIFLEFKTNFKESIFTILFFIIIYYIFFILFWEYFFFRYENIQNFRYYFDRNIISTPQLILDDFRNVGTILIYTIFQPYLSEKWDTIYFINSLFQILGGFYLLKLFKIFSKNFYLILICIISFFSFHLFFLSMHTLEYVNVIIPIFIIYIYSIISLEHNHNKSLFSLYISSYIFLISLRPDFFFLSLIIEFFNAYLYHTKRISFLKIVLFYIFLIPYYIVINYYLLWNIHKDVWLTWAIYHTQNYWHIFIDRVFSSWILEKLSWNVQYLFDDKILIFFVLASLIGIFYSVKMKKNVFWISFLFFYCIIYFFIVVYIHKEWFIYSSFKYASIIYLIMFINTIILLLELDNDKRLYKIIPFFCIIFLWISFINSWNWYYQTISKLHTDSNFRDSYFKIITNKLSSGKQDPNIYNDTYNNIINENWVSTISKYLNIEQNN